MSQFPDKEIVINRTLELLGGPDRARQVIDAEFDSMTKRWNQDVESIGRILRAHLYLEHYMTEYLEKSNPRLGSLSDARLSFNQKVLLLDANPSLIDLIPGIKRLNTVRNRLAHQLTAIVREEDAAVFLEAGFFKAMRDEGGKPNLPSQNPLDILEEFAQHASVRFSSEFGEFSKAFAQALREFKS